MSKVSKGTIRLGGLLAPMGRAAGNPREIAEACRRFEGEGYSSIWIPQAIGRGFMFTDPFVALAVAATVTEQAELGTAVVQVPLYEPVDLAHRISSLTQLAPNRLLMGVGAGSTATDFQAYGRDFASRFGTFDESMAKLRVLRDAGALDDTDLSSWPSVLGKPPFLLGSWGEGVERAATDFDGWIASATYRETPAIIAAHQRYREAGGKRAIVSTIQVPPGTDLGSLRNQIETYAEAGIDDAVVMLLPGGPSAAEVRAIVPP